MSSSSKQSEPESYLAKRVRENNQELRDSGYTVTEMKPSDTRVYKATFVSRKPSTTK